MRVVMHGRCSFVETFEAMRTFTEARGPDTADELWLCEHDPVYTQGIAGRPEHVLDAGGLAVVATNRGGQVTYHGPGQVVAYPLVNLQRLGLHVKTYVHRLESAVLNALIDYGVTGHRVPSAPGIYVDLQNPFGHERRQGPFATGPQGVSDALQGLGKIAALGIKVTRHSAYHGVALNVAMDLSPFSRINPCGHAGLRTIDLATLDIQVPWEDAAQRLAQRLTRQLAPAAAPSPSST